MSLVGRLLSTPPLTAVGLVLPLLDPTAHGRPLRFTPAPNAPGFRLVTNNGLFTNRRPHEWARAILDLAPDVLVVQEATDPLVDALRRAGIDEALPHAHVDPDRDRGGCVLFARMPLVEPSLVAGQYGGVRAAFELDGGVTVTVVGVHPRAPVAPRDAEPWRASFEAVADVVDAASGPIVCAGDWNATMAHRPLRTLLERTGLVDAHTRVGRGNALTWPAQRPIALLDRVLVSSELAVRAIAEATVPGSDHRAVIADLAVLTG